MNPTPEFPATSSALSPLTPSAVRQEARSAGSLSDFFYQQAQQAINTVDPIPLAPISPPCVTGEAQHNNRESAGSPYLCDWSMDTRPTYKLTDAEALDKMHWQFQALCKRERLQRVLEVPTVYPEVK